MKIKKNLLIGMTATLVLTFSAFAAHAGKDTYRCESATITKSGIYSYSKNTRALYAECDDQNAWEGERMFFIPNGKDEDTMYAAALTALASGYKVDLTLSKFKEGSLVRAIIVNGPTNN
jgi:hypothetical protein